MLFYLSLALPFLGAVIFEPRFARSLPVSEEGEGAEAKKSLFFDADYDTQDILRKFAMLSDGGDGGIIGGGETQRRYVREAVGEKVMKQFMLFGDLMKNLLVSAVVEPKTSSAAAIPNSPGDQGGGFTMFSCSSCTFGVNMIKSFVNRGSSIESITKTAETACMLFKVAKDYVCKGIIKSFVYDLVEVLNTTKLNEKDICGFFLGSKCESENFEEIFNWTVSPSITKKPPLRHIDPPQDGYPTQRILHLSDTHLDLFYQEGSLAICGAPLCCRGTLGIPDDPRQGAGKWGDYRDCDSPLWTVENMMEHISQTHKPDFIIWTGDLPPHDVYNQTKQGNVNIIKILSDIFQKYFPDTPVFPALGNHEAEPVNAFPQPEVGGDFSVAWLYDELSKSWSTLVKQDVSRTVSWGGYYSVPISPGFRIISLNMNYCNNKNIWLLVNSTDPAQELQWLIDELQHAENNKEKVYILGHIPPGNEDCAKVWSRNFNKIINRYEGIIAAQFYGHTHYDEYLLFYDEENPDRPTSIAYIGASTTPYSNMNPAYKMYTIDGSYPSSTRMVVDAETYYMNLTEANLLDKPTWRKLYSAKEEYGLLNLLPSDWDEFMQKLKDDDVLYNKFLKNLHRDSDSFPPCNDDKCRNQVICRQVSAKTGDNSKCTEMELV